MGDYLMTYNPTTTNDTAKLKISTNPTITTGTITYINLGAIANQTTTPNAYLNAQVGTATPTNGSSITTGFIQVNQAGWYHISGTIRYASTNTTGVRAAKIQQWAAGGGAAVLANEFMDVITLVTGLSNTPFGESASHSVSISQMVYASQYHYFNLLGLHTAGVDLTLSGITTGASLTVSFVSL